VLNIGAALATVLAAGFTWYNFAKAGDHISFVAGTSIALICGLIAIGSDLQGNVTARLGALANTSVVRCREGVACLVGWGAFNVAMFQIVLLYPVWASETFHFQVGDNLLGTGLLVGVSAVIIIRSKLTKVNNIEWGGEWLYLWSGARVLDAVNRRRVAIKQKLEAAFAPHVANIAGLPTFFTDLETHVNSLLPGLPTELQTDVNKELQQLKTSFVPAGSPNPANVLDKDATARKVLVSVVIDYLGDDELKSWATSKHLTLS
jgi:hypothetical protein